MVARFATTMDHVHDRERIPPPDDAKEVLDAAVARGRVRGARVGASTGRNVVRADVRWAAGHWRNVASRAPAGKQTRRCRAYLPRPNVTRTFCFRLVLLTSRRSDDRDPQQPARDEVCTRCTRLAASGGL